MEPSNRSPSKTPETFEIHIEKLVEGGFGLGYLNGQVVFIPWTLPGEKIEIKPPGRQKDYIKANPIRILSPSPKRTQPPCSLYQVCGGCKLQHIEYTHQTLEKMNIFKETLHRIGKVSPSLISPAVFSNRPYFYRNRCQLRVRFHQGRNILGYNEFHTHRIVPVEECLLLEPPINGILKTLSQTLSGDLAISYLRRIHIQFSAFEKQFLLSLYSVGPLSFPLKRLYDTLHALFPLKGLIAYSSSGRQVLGLDYLFHQLGTFSLRAGDRTFVQIHWELNHLLVDILLKWLSPLDGKRVLELYSGMGNFSLPLAKEGAEVTGLDENPHAIQDAIENTKQNQVTTCRFQSANLNHGLPKKKDIPREVDALLVDPPREGLPKKLCQDILALSPRSIVYISCSPSTLARDLHLLTQNHYRVRRIQPVNLFPQTPHLEALVQLERKG